MRIWTCKIGECDDKDLLTADGKYYGADWPMRKAIQEAYRQVTGREPRFTFSGWAGTLTKSERAAVEAAGREVREMKKKLTPEQRLLRIAEILERVDGRCMAADGPVTQTKEEIDATELREIYVLASGARSKPKKHPYNATMGVTFGTVRRAGQNVSSQESHD